MYTKQDARMTQGLAILYMLVLHLFCRRGADVYGTPLIWLNKTTPLVYVFGFNAEVCVYLYSLTAGYAQELLFEQGKSSWGSRSKRILKLMQPYWVVVALFSLIGLMVNDPLIPGSATQFLKALFLLHSYNGAWWFLHSYVLMLLIPPAALLYPVKRLNLKQGGLLCAAITVLWYLLGRFDLRLSGYVEQSYLRHTLTELENLTGILPAVWFGGLMCRHRAFNGAAKMLNQLLPGEKSQKMALGIVLAGLILGFYAVHKAVLASFSAVLVFLIFNLWKKSTTSQKVFTFLGNHSTNIWLTHMFFYLCLFPGLVQRLKYPPLMLVALLGLSLLASYAINGLLMLIRLDSRRA